MADNERLVAVQATKREYYVLRHPVTGESLDEHGAGLWPRDQNTFRLRIEGSIKFPEDEQTVQARETAKSDEVPLATPKHKKG